MFSVYQDPPDQPPDDADPLAQDAIGCPYCRSETREDVLQAAFRGQRGWVVIEGIPARVCEGCGEQFYDERTTRQIEEILADPVAKPQRRIVVPIFVLAETESQ
jgi:YgiT-type zinc finger domain-containing protein